MFDPFNEQDLGRLRRSVTSSRKKWKEHLEHRMDFMRQVAGFHYGKAGDAAPENVIFPLLGLAMKIYARLISSNDPRAHVEHWNPEFDPYCHELKIALNDEFERINLASSLNAVTVESFFLKGVGKVGRVDEGATEEAGGYLHRVGGIFFDQILNENFVFDMLSTKWELIGYCGDIARVPLEWVRENKGYKKRARQAVRPTNKLSNDPMVGNFQRIRSQLLSTGGQQTLDQEYEDHVELLNLWFPRERMLLVCDREINNVLSWREWDGPDRGPYHFLGYNYLPGNLVPLAPLAEWMDQHLSANRLANHVVNTAVEAKTVYGVNGPEFDADANAITNSKHGDVVRLSGTPQSITFNAPDNTIWGLATMLKDSFVWTAGNLDGIAGLSPQSPTASQDKLLLDSASRQVQDMQQDVTKLVQNVMTDIAWYMRNDPTWRRQLVKQVENTNRRIPFMAVPSDLPGDFADYRIRLEPFSMQSRTPQQRGAMLVQDFKELLMPMQPILEQRGIAIDFEKLLKKYAELTDKPELSDVLIYLKGEQSRPAGDRTQKPAETTRNYNRFNIPQSTRSAKDRITAQLAFGGDVQPKEKANLVR